MSRGGRRSEGDEGEKGEGHVVLFIRRSDKATSAEIEELEMDKY